MEVVFASERLLFREFTAEDADLIYRLNLDPAVTKYLHEEPTTMEVATNVLNNVILPQYKLYNHGRWAVHLKDNLEFIGWCGLKQREEYQYPDLGYRFMQKYWGKGYGYEAAMRTIEYGFMVLELPAIMAAAHVENHASKKILVKCGFKFITEKMIDDAPANYYELHNPQILD